MTTLNIGIASAADYKARTMAIARGELEPSGSAPKVWFTSIESLAKVLSDRNRALLVLIADEKPESLQALGPAHRAGQVQPVAHLEDDGGLWLRSHGEASEPGAGPACHLRRYPARSALAVAGRLIAPRCAGKTDRLQSSSTHKP